MDITDRKQLNQPQTLQLSEAQDDTPGTSSLPSPSPWIQPACRLDSPCIAEPSIEQEVSSLSSWTQPICGLDSPCIAQKSIRQDDLHEISSTVRPVYGLCQDLESWRAQNDRAERHDWWQSRETPSESPSVVEAPKRRKRGNLGVARRNKHCPRCEFCGRGFDRKSNLTTHLKVHDVGRRIVPCDIPGCDKFYGRRADVNRHKRTVSRCTLPRYIFS